MFLLCILAACTGSYNSESSDEINTVPKFVNNATDNSLPYITAPTQAIATNEGATTVTTVVAQDPNGDVPLTYKLEGNVTSSTDHAAFEISSAGVITYKTAPTYITQSAYSFTVVVSDQFHSVKKDINVTVNIPPFAWKSATPEAQGMDATKLQEAIDYTFTDEFNTQGLPSQTD